MKSLKQYIFEKLSKEEFLDKIHNMYNDDYEAAYNLLTNYDKIIRSINDYDLNQPNDVLTLITLFKDRNLPLNVRNKSIIKNIYKEFNIDTINNFVNLCNDPTKDIFNINDGNEILRNNDLFKFEKGNEKLKDLIKYLIDIDYFSKPKNSASSGKFELLFILLFGKSKNGNGEDDIFSGDLHVGNDTIEIKSINTIKKSAASLGSNVGKTSLEELSVIFLQSIFTNKNDKETIKKIFNGTEERGNFEAEIRSFFRKNGNKQSFKTPQPNRCLGNTSANINIMSILNTFFNGKNISENLCKTIFECYIEVLLSQYGQENKTNDVLKALTANDNENNYNPFFIENNFIYCKRLTQITGAIQLFGYALAQNFNHILICNESNSECICIKNVKKAEVIRTVLDNIIFDPAEINNEKGGRINNVSKIKDFI